MNSLCILSWILCIKTHINPFNVLSCFVSFPDNFISFSFFRVVNYLERNISPSFISYFETFSSEFTDITILVSSLLQPTCRRIIIISGVVEVLERQPTLFLGSQEFDTQLLHKLLNLVTGILFLLPINSNFPRHSSWDRIVWFHHLKSTDIYLWLDFEVEIIILTNTICNTLQFLHCGASFF